MPCQLSQVSAIARHDEEPRRRARCTPEENVAMATGVLNPEMLTLKPLSGKAEPRTEEILHIHHGRITFTL